MTADTDGWLEKLAKQRTEDVLDQPLPNRDEIPRSTEEETIIQSPRRPRMVRLSTVLLLAVLLPVAGFTTAAFMLQQTASTTSGQQPAVGSTTLNMGNVAACTSPCNGTLVQGTGTPPGPAVTFHVTAINAGYSFNGGTMNGVFLVVHGSVTVCGTTAPLGSISIPASPGSAITVTTNASGYDWCVYYSSVPANTPLSVTVTWQA